LNAQELEKKHHFQVYNRFPVTLSHGTGALVWDIQGNQYIDLLAGIAVNNLGHAHPAIVHAIKEQAEKLLHTSNFYYTEAQSEFVARLSYLSGLDRVFFVQFGIGSDGSLRKIGPCMGSSTW
jgi:acetylornithine/N-succinyldiaminopimelate aminotransferase